MILKIELLIHSFVQITKQQTRDYGKLTSIRCWYSNGLEVEYGMADKDWLSYPLHTGKYRMFRDGLLVLFARNELLYLEKSQVVHQTETS